MAEYTISCHRHSPSNIHARIPVVLDGSCLAIRSRTDAKHKRTFLQAQSRLVSGSGHPNMPKRLQDTHGHVLTHPAGSRSVRPDGDRIVSYSCLFRLASCWKAGRLSYHLLRPTRAWLDAARKREREKERKRELLPGPDVPEPLASFRTNRGLAGT